MVDEFVVRRCKSILKKHKDLSGYSQPLGGILREMRIAVKQLHQLEHRRKEFLNQVEYFRSRLRDKQLNIRRDPVESQDLRMERDNKEQRLFESLINLESQRRTIVTMFDTEERLIEKSLLKLINQYEVLTMLDGNE